MKKKENSLKYAMSLQGNVILQGMVNRKTARRYGRYGARFADWLAGQGIKRASQVKVAYGSMTAAVQAWADSMAAAGMSASTIHTYLSGVCKATGIPLGDIHKPRRVTADNVRGRGSGGGGRGRREAESGKYDRLLDFARRVGIRRAELARLTGRDLVVDLDGVICVHVRKGKGGKEQLQAILPADEQLVASYFDGTDRRIFPDDVMNNRLNLHAIRAAHARECYTY